jgi:hypothetical protein
MDQKCDPSAIEELESALAKERTQLALVGILYALIKCGRNKYLPDLTSLLKSDDYYVVTNCIESG